MRDQSDSSSDLSRTIALSRRLSPRQPIQARGSKPDRPTDYSKYLRGKVPARAPTKRSRPHEVDLPGPGREIRSWEALIGWCTTALPADAGLVVDGKGFVIAHGGAAIERFEDLGAELSAAMDQLAPAHRDEGTMRWVEVVTLRDRTLCFPIAVTAGWEALVVLVTSVSHDVARLESISKHIMEVGRRLARSRE